MGQCGVLVLLLCFTSIWASPLEKVLLKRTPANGISSRIVNGNLATLGQFPWQALLNVRGDENGWICGAVIIHNQWVLTTGHCITDASYIYIWAGITNFGDANPVAESDEFHKPDSFDLDTLRDDLGLVRTKQQFTFSNDIRSITIAPEDVNAGVAITVSGFGSSETGGGVQLLHYAELTTITNAVCRQTYGDATVTDGMVCAVSDGNPVRSPCHGDSGGPAVIDVNSNPNLVGIISWVSDEACESTLPQGYTRVVYYREWIRQITGLPL